MQIVPSREKKICKIMRVWEREKKKRKRRKQTKRNEKSRKGCGKVSEGIEKRRKILPKKKTALSENV